MQELEKLLTEAVIKADELKEQALMALDFPLAAMYRDVGDCCKKSLKLMNWLPPRYLND